MKDLSSYYPDRHLLQYTFHISLDPAFVYVNNAKCGCTTAKASINRWYAAWHGKSLDYKSAGDIHERAYNPLLTPGQVGPRAEDIILRDAGVFRFTLLREPVKRIASAYASKMTWDTRERRLLNGRHGRELGEFVPFSLFLSMVCEDAEFRNMNEHWRPQASQIAISAIKYDYICLQEILTKDLLAVRDLIFPGLELGVFETLLHFPANQSASGKIIEQIGPDEISMIRGAYEEDFALYDDILKTRVAGDMPAVIP